jgi:DNA-binding response OmpR family regulator
MYNVPRSRETRKKLEVSVSARILFVDDEHDLLESYSALLEAEGYHVTTEDGGWPAFERIKTESFEVVITDVRMMNGDGIELLEKVQSLGGVKPPVIIMSGFADVLPNDLLDRGATAFLSKPVQLRQLLLALTRALKPRTQRWLSSDLKDTVTVIPLDAEFPDFAKALTSGEIELGQGGFFLQLEGNLPTVESVISFRLTFKAGTVQSLHGVGIVRWARAAARHGFRRGVGVEILSLDASAIPTIDLEITQRDPRAFVPLGCTVNLRT